MSQRLSIELDDDDAALLSDEAQDGGVDPQEFASSLLRNFLRGRAVDPDAAAAVLDADPQAFEAAQLGRAQGRRGETVALEQLGFDPARHRATSE